MPFCTQCGHEVARSDQFCAFCGTRQDAASGKPSDFLSNISPRTASLLCYIPVVGWIPCVVVLAAQRFRNERATRFHAFQGLYLFVVWLIIDWGFMPFFWFDTRTFLRVSMESLFKMVIFAIWIFMLVKTSQNEDYRLPILGDLADRSLAEQK